MYREFNSKKRVKAATKKKPAKRARKSSEIDLNLSGELFLIDQILGKRIDPLWPKKFQYLVKWKGYGMEDNTWEGDNLPLYVINQYEECLARGESIFTYPDDDNLGGNQSRRSPSPSPSPSISTSVILERNIDYIPDADLPKAQDKSAAKAEKPGPEPLNTKHIIQTMEELKNLKIWEIRGIKVIQQEIVFLVQFQGRQEPNMVSGKVLKMAFEEEVLCWYEDHVVYDEEEDEEVLAFKASQAFTDHMNKRYQGEDSDDSSDEVEMIEKTAVRGIPMDQFDLPLDFAFEESELSSSSEDERGFK